jgi:hypothetical protein
VERRHGKRLSAQATAERDQRIAELRLGFTSWGEIAQTVGLSETQAQEGFRRWKQREKGTIGGRDPVAWVEELIWQFEHKAAQLEAVAEAAPNPSARIGALRSSADMLAKAATIAQESGMLPRNLGVLRTERDVKLIIRIIGDVFEDYDVPIEAQQKIAALATA